MKETDADRKMDEMGNAMGTEETGAPPGGEAEDTDSETNDLKDDSSEADDPGEAQDSTESGEDSDEEEIDVDDGTIDLSSVPRYKIVFAYVRIITVVAALLVLAGKTLIDKHNYKKGLYRMYELSCDQVRKDLDGVANLRIDDFEKDNVKLQKWDNYKFYTDYGTLRYAWYTVSLHVEYDVPSGHQSIDPTMYVYYYSGDDNVPSHFHVNSLFEDVYDFDSESGGDGSDDSYFDWDDYDDYDYDVE